jgi:dynein heavy chain
MRCGETWKSFYLKTAHNVAQHTPNHSWNFNHSSIFVQMEAFVQRCKELIEICESQLQFGRKSKTGQKVSKNR